MSKESTQSIFEIAQNAMPDVNVSIPEDEEVARVLNNLVLAIAGDMGGE